MMTKFSFIFTLLIISKSCRRCATQYSDSANIDDVNVKNSITVSDCAAELNNFDQCMQKSYGPDDYKLDDNVYHVFADNSDWEICYQNQSCSGSQIVSPLIKVKVNGAEHEINMDEVQTAAAKCALPLLTTNVNPILEKCVRAHIGKDSAWKVPTASIESLTQSIEWNRGYIPTVEAGFLTPFFDAEADIRAGYQHQLSHIESLCSSVTDEGMNDVHTCLMDRAHHLITKNSERINTAQRKLYGFCAGKSKCENNISAQCKAVRNETIRYLIECYEEIDWTTIWPKIKQPYIDCVKKIPTMSFIELSSVVSFGDATLTVDDNLQNYLRNATIGVTKKLNETFIEPLNIPNTVDECSKSNTYVLGKDYDEKVFDAIEIQGTQNVLLVKRTHNGNDVESTVTELPGALGGSDDEEHESTPKEQHDGGEFKVLQTQLELARHKIIMLEAEIGELKRDDDQTSPRSRLERSNKSKSHGRRTRALPSCADATKACSGAVSSRSLKDIMAERFGANSYGGISGGGGLILVWCVEGGSCKTELLVQLLSRPFVRYFEVIQSFTPSYNRLSNWGINEKVNRFGS